MTRKMPTPATDSDIKALARAILSGDVYTHGTVPPDMIPVVFAPVGLGALKGYTRSQLDEIVVWANYRRHLNRGAVNNYPMFFGCAIWLRKDFNAAVDLAERTISTLEESP